MDRQYLLCHLWGSTGLEVFQRRTFQWGESGFSHVVVGWRSLLHHNRVDQIRMGGMDDIQLHIKSLLHQRDSLVLVETY